MTNRDGKAPGAHARFARGDFDLQSRWRGTDVRKPVTARGRIYLSFALQELAILYALYELHLDLGFLVRDIAAGFGRHD